MTITEFQKFALDEWLSAYPPDIGYDAVLDTIMNPQSNEEAWSWCPWAVAENLTHEQLVENIENTRQHAEAVFSTTK